VNFESKCTSVDLDARTVSFQHDDTTTQLAYDLLVRARLEKGTCAVHPQPSEVAAEQEAEREAAALALRVQRDGVAGGRGWCA
jgi:NADH dehydrogenase FAD-containing subunit